MEIAFLLGPLAGPIVLIAAGLTSLTNDGVRPERALLASRLGSLTALFTAILTVAMTIITGPVDSLTVGVDALSIGTRIDALSTILSLLVAFVGVIVLQFSRNYLDGDARQGWFLAWMCFTLASVMTLVVAGTLILLAAAWIATSLCLHKLLVHYSDRPGAQLAAHKKFVVARLSDLALIAAFILIGGSMGEWQIGAIMDAARIAEPNGMLTAAACLIAIAAVLKSAQFPSHGWLIEVMETPTPVSALLHAGIVNAGGFLVIRFADIVMLSSSSLWMLAIIGGGTALIGSAAMLTQSSIKTTLAWSTVAQMGFMIMQCGFGAFSAALLHIVAHSFYKAHAFLSSGSAIDKIRIPETGSAIGAPSLPKLLMGFAVALAVFLAVGQQFGITASEKPGYLVFGAVIVLGLAHYLARGFAARSVGYVMIQVSLTSAAIAVLYFSLQAGTAYMMTGIVPEVSAPISGQIILMGLIIAGFAGLTVVQNLPTKTSQTPFFQALRIHFSNGLYANAIFNKLVGRPYGPAQTLSGATQ
ncbi:MAG: NADH-quinone oxidoreductase subunit L [Pseudomonadota bacterium]